MPKFYILFILFIALFAGLFLIANTAPEHNDPYTGLYYVHGSKIISTAAINDTTHFASVVAVKLMKDKTDTLHFFGFPGADEGEAKQLFGRQQLSDYSVGMSGYDMFSPYRIYGAYSDDFFEINHNNIGRHYRGTGTISDDRIDIHGQLTYRSFTVDYELTGEKIYTIHK